ncbi:MAG: NAD(P)/FAD-dependent oxidoreductase [Gammaproteobacteria bacterium]|jgi:sulfide:quinone oxidoreductase|nr:NAD(P)/FAD-dependent oxidoreductase [Gammaproteobacteria bacterium]
MTSVVVLGAGIGGISQVFELRKELGKGDRVVMVNDSEFFEFTPSNPWVAVGWRKPEQIRVSLKELFAKHDIEFVQDAAARLHPEENRVELASGTSVDYDYLVIATGPKLAFEEVEGLGPEGYTSSVCKTGHAQKASLDFEELARNPGPVVVGAAQGASCFGPAYEYAFIVDTELRRRKIRDKVPMYFVTPEPYVGHLGLDGVGDTKGMMESELRQRHVHWLANSKINRVEAGKMVVTEVNPDGSDKAQHELAFKHAMILPAFKGIDAVFGIEGLVNPRGFILIDEFQRNPRYKNIYAVGVCVAIPPVGPTVVPTGTPKTGYMIESMVTATTHNILAALAGREPAERATWNALCLADFGDSGVAFLALPQIPPRNTNWAARGKWVHLAKIGFEKYFLRKVRNGQTEPYYEKFVLKLMGAHKTRSN